MDKRILFDTVMMDYKKYISYCAYRFYEQMHFMLDAIYDKDDIEQMVYVQIWTYIGRYDKNKSSLKTYIVMMMKTIFYRCIYLSNMEKRQTRKACSLQQPLVNNDGDIMTVEDTVMDTTLPNQDDNLSEFFYKQILTETYRRVYELVKQGYTYREIGKKFNVSGQRIDQIMHTIGNNIRYYENR